MMAYEGSESAQDNLGKIIYPFQPETKTLIRKLERILKKLYSQNLSLCVPLLARLFDVFHIKLLLCSYSHPSSPCWPKLLDNFIFLSSWCSSEWSFPIYWIPHNNYMDPPVVCEPFYMFNPVELLISLLHDHFLYSAPLHSTLDVLPTWIYP